MCGIFFCNFKLNKGQKKFVYSWLKKRGPDGVEEYSVNSKLLIHSRLSIVGNIGSKQPIISGKSVLVCNGEIYNYEQLVEEYKLSVEGSSDCEVVQALYDKKEILNLNLFDGMYAGFLYDFLQDKLICFRDFAGEKPLYYFKKGEDLAIASEWSVLANLFKVKTFNDYAIQEYYFKQFVANNSVFDGLEVIKPGTVVEFNFKNSSVKATSFSALESNSTKISKREFFEGFRYNVIESVKNCITHGDHKPIVSLSSGLDSNLIASVARYLKLDFDICTLGFNQLTNFDESLIAKKLSHNFYKKKPFEFVFSENYTKINIKDAILNRCDLIGDGSVFVIDELLKNIAHNKYKVYVSGIGGDELFSDYPWAQRFKGLNSFRDMSIPQKIFNRLFSKKTGFKDFWQTRIYYQHLLKSNLFKPDIYDFSVQSPLKQVKNELNHYLIENGLAQTDRLSLRYGVEARSPLVSKNIRHFLDDYHFEGIEELIDPKQIIYRKSFSDIMPKEIFGYRKQGFRAPIEKLSSLMVELYSDEIINTQNEVITVRQFKHLNDAIKRIYLNILLVSNETGMSFNDTK